MIVAIQDANILIDLHNAGLLELYFRLGIETHTTDLVLIEVRQPVTNYVKGGQLRVKSFTGNELAGLLTFKAGQPRGLSLADCSVLQFAMERSAVLLTGDGSLRKHAQSKGVDTHGILWLMDMMVHNKTFDLPTAIKFLRKLIVTNSRLPQAECENRLKLWESGRSIPPRRVE